MCVSVQNSPLYKDPVPAHLCIVLICAEWPSVWRSHSSPPLYCAYLCRMALWACTKIQFLPANQLLQLDRSALVSQPQQWPVSMWMSPSLPSLQDLRTALPTFLPLKEMKSLTQTHPQMQDQRPSVSSSSQCLGLRCCIHPAHFPQATWS